MHNTWKCSDPSTGSLDTSSVVLTSPMVSTVVTMKPRMDGSSRGAYTDSGNVYTHRNVMESAVFPPAFIVVGGCGGGGGVWMSRFLAVVSIVFTTRTADHRGFQRGRGVACYADRADK